jgi:hypothetical protein
MRQASEYLDDHPELYQQALERAKRMTAEGVFGKRAQRAYLKTDAQKQSEPKSTTSSVQMLGAKWSWDMHEYQMEGERDPVRLLHDGALEGLVLATAWREASWSPGLATSLRCDLSATLKKNYMFAGWIDWRRSVLGRRLSGFMARRKRGAATFEAHRLAGTGFLGEPAQYPQPTIATPTANRPAALKMREDGLL